jgi:hypothetical protein
MFTFTDLVLKVTKDHETYVKWCQENGLIRSNRVCDVCGSDMILRVRSDKTAIEWWCRKRGSNPQDISKSAVANTWFEKSKLTIEKIMIITYMFSQGWTNYDNLIHEISTEDTETSWATIAKWIGHCRDVCFIWIDNYMNT